MRAIPFALILLPARTVSDPPWSQPVPYPSAKRHGSHGGSYGINKSGAHAPQLPLLLPSATTSHPFASSSLRPTTVSVAFRYILLSRFLLHPSPPVPSSGTGIPLATAMDFVLSPQPTTLNRANFHLPIPSFPSPLDVSILPETTAKTIQRARSVPGVSA